MCVCMYVYIYIYICIYVCISLSLYIWDTPVSATNTLLLLKPLPWNLIAETHLQPDLMFVSSRCSTCPLLLRRSDKNTFPDKKAH